MDLYMVRRDTDGIVDVDTYHRYYRFVFDFI